MIATSAMQRLALLFVLIVAVLAAAMHPAEAATIGAGYGTAAVQMVHGDHAATTEYSGNHGEQGDEGLDHHHCPSCWIAGAAPRIKQTVSGPALLIVARYGSLSSRSDDPLLEPPAA